MLKSIFRRTPTVEEFREQIIKSLKTDNIQMPDDARLDEEIINGFEYIQKWVSNNYHMEFNAICLDVRNPNSKIYYTKRRIGYPNG